MKHLSQEEMEFVHFAMQELDNQDEFIRHFEEDFQRGLIDCKFNF